MIPPLVDDEIRGEQQAYELVVVPHGRLHDQEPALGRHLVLRLERRHVRVGRVHERVIHREQLPHALDDAQG